MSKDRRQRPDDYNISDEERRLKKFEPYRKIRKPIPPPGKFFTDKRAKEEAKLRMDVRRYSSGVIPDQEEPDGFKHEPTKEDN